MCGASPLSRLWNTFGNKVVKMYSLTLEGPHSLYIFLYIMPIDIELYFFHLALLIPSPPRPLYWTVGTYLATPPSRQPMERTGPKSISNAVITEIPFF